MEKTHIIIKGGVHRKSIKRVGKGEDIAMATTTEGEIR
jgi:hypothetical protein